jgi:hypothetical protein
MKIEDILSLTMVSLQKQDDTYDFNSCLGHIECIVLKLKIHPVDFEVDQVFHFEGMSNTDDNSVLYAIRTEKGIKGVPVDAYGVYAENILETMLRELR